MNKLFTKIATAFVGMAMAIGVGVAVSKNGTSFSAARAASTSFATSDFSGQGKSGSGGNISATKDNVTFACDKGYGTTQIRCYSGGKITISTDNGDLISAISFTFSGSYTGGLSTSYTGLSTTSWEATTSSQARFTAITVTHDAQGAAKSISVESPVEINFSSSVKTATLTAVKNNGAEGTVTWSLKEGTCVSLPETKTGDSIVVTATAVGQAIITASCSDCEEPVDVEINVVQIEHAGTLADPFTPKDAILKAQIQGSTASTEFYYVRGVVKSYSWNSTYKNYDNIILAETTSSTETFQLYHCYANSGNVKFKQASLIAQGNTITAVGQVINYFETTPQMTSGCYVYSKVPTALAVTGISGSFNVGDEPTIAELGVTITATYDDGSQADVTASATITDGTPLASKGDNEITFSYSEEHPYSGVMTAVTAKATLTDVIQPVTSVNITSDVSQVNIGDKIQLTAEALPLNANNRTLTWSTSDATVATVDAATGEVTGVASGTARITATSNNEKSAYVDVLVTDPTDVPTALTITGTLEKSAYYVGEQFDPTGLTVTVTMSNSGGSDVTSSVVWTPNPLSTAGENIEVTASYTLDEITVHDSVFVRVVNREVIDFALTAPTKLTYIESDTALDLTGMEVLVEYTLGDIEDITDKVELSEVDFTKTDEEQTVTVSFTFNEVKLTVGTFKVKVNELSCPLTKGQQYVLAAYDKKNSKYFELTSFSTNPYGVGTQYHTNTTSKYPLANSMVFTAVQGTIDGSVALKTSDNKYLAWSSGNSLELSETFNNASSWTITIDSTTTSGLTYSILSNVGTPARQIFWNISSPRFACYTGKTIGDSYGGVMIYEYDYCKAGNFVEDYMHPEISLDDTGASSSYATCKGTGYYDVAKPAFNLLPERVRIRLSEDDFEFHPYFERLLAWAKANGDLIVDNQLINQSNPASSYYGNSNSDSNSTIVVIIALLGVTAIGGYFFLRKKKEQQ